MDLEVSSNTNQNADRLNMKVNIKTKIILTFSSFYFLFKNIVSSILTFFYII
jgi:hypothetical protein